MKNPRTISLIISSICILIIDLTQLLDYLETGDFGGRLSTIFFILANICMVIAWFSYFIDKKKA